MKTFRDVNNDMSLVFDKFRAGELKRGDTAEAANVAGKIIQTLFGEIAIDDMKLRRDMFSARIEKVVHQQPKKITHKKTK